MLLKMKRLLPAIDQQAQYLALTKERAICNNNLSYAFPPHSFTQIKIGVKKN